MRKLQPLLVLLLLCSQCKKEVINPDFTGNVYRTTYGLSITLYPEYKKLNETEDSVLFSKAEGEDIIILLWKENARIIEKYYKATQTQGISLFKLKDQDAYLIIKKEKIGFREYVNIRLEIFPEEKEVQITILARGKEKDYKKLINMLSTITLE